MAPSKNDRTWNEPDNSWIHEKLENVIQKNDLKHLYAKLLIEEEQTSPKYHHSNEIVRHHGCYSLSNEATDLETLLHKLLSVQRSLLPQVESEFSVALAQRVAVIQKICTASYDHIFKSKPSKCKGLENAKESNEKCAVPASTKLPGGKSSKEALLEVGVKAGLSLVFSLLHQDFEKSLPAPSSLGSQVLTTALSIVRTLPPLSLSNESQLTGLGIESLTQVCEFLQGTVTSTSSQAGAAVKHIALELLLDLAVQRGSLPHLLHWINTALLCSDDSRVSLEGFYSALATVKLSRPSSSPQSHDCLTPPEAALTLLQELVAVADDNIKPLGERRAKVPVDSRTASNESTWSTSYTIEDISQYRPTVILKGGHVH